MVAKFPSLHRGAVANVGFGIVEKFILLAIAGVAFWFLVSLDGAKTRYDIYNDKNNASSINVSQAFVGQLNIPDARSDVKAWLDNAAYFKYHQFSSQKEFINALGARAVADYTIASAKIETENRNLPGQIEKATAEQKQLTAGTPEWEKKRKSIAEMEATLEGNKTKPAELTNALNNQSGFIYGTLKNALPKVMLASGNHKESTLDQLFKPFLDESSSLNLVFQTLRMTVLVVIVLTFIFIVVVGFQMLPLATGGATASDQLRSLMSLKGGSVASEAAKIAIIGITAVGVGTAVVIGSQALQGAGDALVLSSHDRGSSDTGGYRPSYTIQTPTAEHPIEFKPTINVPEIKVPQAVVLDRSTVDTSGTEKILEQLRIITAALATSSDVKVLDVRIKALENKKSDLNTVCDCVSVLIGGDKPNTDPTKLIPKPQDPDPTRLIPKPQDPDPTNATPKRQDPVGPSTPTSSPSADNKLPKLNLPTALDGIHEQLIKANETQRLKQRPDARSVFVRGKDFILGAEYYAVTEDSLNNFKHAVSPTPLDPGLETALKDLMSQPPQRKNQFLISLRKRVESAKSQSALLQFTQYERKILYHFKLSN